MADLSALDPLLPSLVLHQFPMPAWVENLAVRSNGQLLVTLSSAPEVFLVNPAATEPSKSAILIHRFPDVTGMSGIVEVEPDRFYVAGGRFDLATFTNATGSYRLWQIDMAAFDRDGDRGGKAVVTEVMRLDGIGMPNGLALLSATEKTILAADCEAGAVFRIDLARGTHEVVVEVDEMKNPPQPFIPIAINGVAVHDGHLYWTNTSKALFCRVAICADGSAADGSGVEVIEQGLVGDDFCFDGAGNAWVTRNPFNTVAVVKAAAAGGGRDGGAVTAAGALDRLELAGATACQFDRRPGREHLLYVVTNGGLAGPVNGTQVEGGKVAVIDTASFKA